MYSISCFLFPEWLIFGSALFLCIFDKNGNDFEKNCHFFPFRWLEFFRKCYVKIVPGREGLLPGVKKLRRAEEQAPKKWEEIEMAFGRKEIREILGDAHTDDIATKLVALHRSVLDPIKDDLDSIKRDAEKWQKDAEKLPEVQKELDALKKDDWKAKYEKEHSEFEGYKTQIAQDAQLAKVKAAYKKLLTEEKISEKALESVLNATDYSKIKLKDDGTLDGLEDLKKDINDKWGGFKTATRRRGESVDNPPNDDNGGNDNTIRDYVRKAHEARFGAAPKQN